MTAITLKPASAAPIRLRLISQEPIRIERLDATAPAFTLRTPAAGEISLAGATALAEEAATRERDDPVTLINALLHSGL